MKKKTIKKIAHAYMKGRWYWGTREPYYWQTSTDGYGVWITEDVLPPAVRTYLLLETTKRGWCWYDAAPFVVNLEPGNGHGPFVD